MISRVSQFLTLFVLVGLLFGNVTSALGEKPILAHIKTGETGALTREFVSIFNNSEEPIDVTGWCIYYASASDVTKTKLACLEPPAENVKLMLSAFSYATIASAEFVVANPDFVPDATFAAGIATGGGHVRLQDKDQSEIDKLGWGTAVSPEGMVIAPHASGSVFERKKINNTQFLQDNNDNSTDFASVILAAIPASGIVEEELLIDVCANLDGMQTGVPDDYFLENDQCVQDVCDNIGGLQATIPAGYESLGGENCTEKIVILESSILSITELLPNATSTDTGKEYIEIYNPNSRSVQLEGYKLQLGPAYSKTYVLENQLLDPFGFVTFSDLLSKLTLPNSSASVRLVAPAGNVVSETAVYNSPEDDEAWALINNVWQFTNRPTPDALNLISLFEEEVASTGGDTELKPCKEGQERNPDTNRCRAIAQADSLVPCKAGQERNPETNRCRAVADTASALVPCDPGEERNSETNRCRKVSAVGEVASAKVTDVPSSAKNKNSFLVFGLIVGALVLYAIYEWRSEIAKLFSRIRAR